MFLGMSSTTLIILGEVLYLLIILGVIIKIIIDTDNSIKSLGYILFVVFIPVIGIILYFLIGVNYRKQKLYKKKLVENTRLFNALRREIYDYTYMQIGDHHKIIGNFERTVKMLLNDSLAPLSQAKKAKLLVNGEEKFSEVFKALEAAKHHIHIQYYIYADDEIGNRIKETLSRKAKQGVEVRFIFDDFGSHRLHHKMLAELRAGGVQVAAFYQVHLYALANRMNYRNHRKIIVIDGHIGFIGGINVGDKYINNGKHKLFWRDTHLKFEGAAVWNLQYTFMSDWNFCAHENITINKYYFNFNNEFIDDKKSQTLIQIASSGPDSTRASIMLSFMGIIMACKERLYITTPYFIPNDTIIDAIKHVALSGIDVRLLVPGKSDSLIVNAASCSNYGDLLEAGVRVYRYQKGFVHAKTIVADNTLSVIGSANMDMRSFDFNFEINALVFDEAINSQLCEVFMEDIGHSIQLDSKKWNNRSRWRKFCEAMARLLSPLL
ncbi:MAG: cardiolipin synthase [Prevotellaceae bacterium]|jgi:cardiolipin synthase|nr:cardiolipin synthase [Prevotellaceae bacterium]